MRAWASGRSLSLPCGFAVAVLCEPLRRRARPACCDLHDGARLPPASAGHAAGEWRHDEGKCLARVSAKKASSCSLAQLLARALSKPGLARLVQSGARKMQEPTAYQRSVGPAAMAAIALPDEPWTTLGESNANEFFFKPPESEP
jgi:hypothetical protein